MQTAQLNCNSTICYFCQQNFSPSVVHDCSQKVFALLNTLAQGRNQHNVFNDIDNLVFQGGGIKGVSYLGVLQQLQKENPSLLKNVKRIAGTSAGSIVALYLGLNLDPETEIKELLNISYADLLDEDVRLNVCTNPTSFFNKDHFVYPQLKDVLLTGLEYLKGLNKKLKEGKIDEVNNEINELVYNVLRYYAYYGGNGYNAVMWLKASRLAKTAVAWLRGLLTQGNEQKAPGDLHIFGFQPNLVPKANKSNGEQVKRSPAPSSSVNLDIMSDEAIERALKAVQEEAERQQSRQMPGNNENHHPITEKEKFARHGKTQSSSKNKIFHYSLAEMLWFISLSQKDYTGHKLQIGLFSGNLIKKRLIEAPIQKKLAQFGINNPNPTFGELASYRDTFGAPLFKPFYVLAFNIQTFRSEVFSVEHTPNVVVSDAVRASMSIPLFFTPVTIRENGVPRQVFYDNGKKSEVVRYMDGGLYDNYPIWIFDDLKYCLQDNLKTRWTPTQRISIMNPRTLGFKLLDKERIDAYLRPFFDKKQTQPKKINTKKYESSFFYIIATVIGAELFEHEESDYINQGNCSRTGYVNNNGVSPVDFNLTVEEKNKLIEQGRKAVLQYKERAKTSFVGEGQKYV